MNQSTGRHCHADSQTAAGFHRIADAHHHGGMRAADYFVLSGDEHGEYLGAD
ncbi:MAG: hypothetical protein ACLR4A_15930 [Christensenellales bacterium]